MSKSKLYGLYGFKYEMAAQYLLLRKMDPDGLIIYLQIVNDLNIRPRIYFSDACIAIITHNKVGFEDLVEFLVLHA